LGSIWLKGPELEQPCRLPAACMLVVLRRSHRAVVSMNLAKM
jgi:hypothetical protein